MHIGSTVGDTAGSVLMYRRLGITEWVISDMIDFVTYDGEADKIVDQPMKVAFGRMPGSGSLELVQPGSSRGPQARLLRERAGLNHMAYWCVDLPRTSRALRDEGATLFATSSPYAAEWENADRPGGIDGLLDQVTTATFTLMDGTLMELVATDMWESGLPHLFGASIQDVIPAPLLLWGDHKQRSADED
jgi:hypothetical protein